MRKKVFAILLMVLTLFSLFGCGGGGNPTAFDPDKIPPTEDALPYPMPKMDITFTASDSNWNFRFHSPRHNYDLQGNSIRYTANDDKSLTLTGNAITINNACWCHINIFLNTVDYKFLVFDVSSIDPGTSFTGSSENTGVTVFKLNKTGLTVIDMTSLGTYFNAERVFIDGWAYLSGGIGKSITIRNIYQTNDPTGAKEAA